MAGACGSRSVREYGALPVAVVRCGAGDLLHRSVPLSRRSCMARSNPRAAVPQSRARAADLVLLPGSCVGSTVRQSARGTTVRVADTGGIAGDAGQRGVEQRGGTVAAVDGDGA